MLGPYFVIQHFMSSKSSCVAITWMGKSEPVALLLLSS